MLTIIYRGLRVLVALVSVTFSFFLFHHRLVNRIMSPAKSRKK